MTALFGGSGPDWLARRVPVPDPGPGQVLVRAHAVSVNNADVAMLASATDPATAHGKEYRAGYEFAGEIAAVGPGVEDERVGERVMGTAPESFAEYVIAHHRHLFGIPRELGYEEAAALPTGLLTEHGALMLGAFQPGQTVLITGASSSIGLVGVQIAKALGATCVIATSRTPAKAALLKQTGADIVIATTTQDLTETTLAATSEQGADVVLDHIGGQTLANCLTATRIGGRLISIGRLDQAESTVNLDTLSHRQLRLRGVSFNFSQADELGRVIAGASELLPAVADGRVRPVIDTVLTFDQTKEAAARLRSDRVVGKIVLTIA